jgi:hypothetical protein
MHELLELINLGAKQRDFDIGGAAAFEVLEEDRDALAPAAPLGD